MLGGGNHFFFKKQFLCQFNYFAVLVFQWILWINNHNLIQLYIIFYIILIILINYGLDSHLVSC